MNYNWSSYERIVQETVEKCRSLQEKHHRIINVQIDSFKKSVWSLSFGIVEHTQVTIWYQPLPKGAARQPELQCFHHKSRVETNAELAAKTTEHLSSSRVQVININIDTFTSLMQYDNFETTHHCVFYVTKAPHKKGA